jgi:hypothetical protein
MLLISFDFLPLAFWACMLALFMGMFWFKRKKRAIRTAQMEQLSQQLNLSFAAADNSGFGKLLQGFDLFKLERRKWGRNGKVTNVMSGQVGDAQVYLFDYTYIVSSGKSSHEIRQTVFFANNNKWSLPHFSLKPENWWRKVMQKIGMTNDINFPENPDFSDKFWLTGGIESMIREQFNPDIQAFLSERPPATIEGNNYYLIAYKPRTVLDAAQAKTFFEHCCQLTQMMQKKEGEALLELAELKAAIPIEIEKGG